MNAFEAIVNELNMKVDQLKDWVGNGQVADFDEYQRMVGEIKGLLYAREYILDLKHRLEHSDDE
jgi:hypothetical protein